MKPWAKGTRSFKKVHLYIFETHFCDHTGPHLLSAHLVSGSCIQWSPRAWPVSLHTMRQPQNTSPAPTPTWSSCIFMVIILG